MKKIIYLIIVLASISINVFAQQSLNLELGPSFNGSGDLPGYNFGIGFNLKTKKTISYNIAIRTTSHAREIELTYINLDSQLINSSYRDMASGIQSEICPTINLLKKSRINLFIAGGCFIRYNTTNSYSQMAYLYPAATGYPIPLIALDLPRNLNYFTVGYLAKIGTEFSISKSNIWKFNLAANLQNDNIGNFIWHIPIGLNYKLSYNKKNTKTVSN